MTSGGQPASILRLTRFSTAYSHQGRRGSQPECIRWTIYGVDASGVEHVYVEHTSEDEHMAWRAADPLWHEAQTAMIRQLLNNPATRDLVLQVNIKAAIDSGDMDTAVLLAGHLSAEARQRLLELSRDETGTEDGTIDPDERL